MENKLHNDADQTSMEQEKGYKRCITPDMVYAINRCSEREQKIIRFIFCVPEDLTENDIKNGLILPLEKVHTYEEASEVFSVRPDIARLIAMKILGHVIILDEERV